MDSKSAFHVSSSEESDTDSEGAVEDKNDIQNQDEEVDDDVDGEEEDVEGGSDGEDEEVDEVMQKQDEEVDDGDGWNPNMRGSKSLFKNTKGLKCITPRVDLPTELKLNGNRPGGSERLTLGTLVEEGPQESELGDSITAAGADEHHEPTSTMTHDDNTMQEMIQDTPVGVLIVGIRPVEAAIYAAKKKVFSFPSDIDASIVIAACGRGKKVKLYEVVVEEERKWRGKEITAWTEVYFTDKFLSNFEEGTKQTDRRKMAETMISSVLPQPQKLPRAEKKPTTKSKPKVVTQTNDATSINGNGLKKLGSNRVDHSTVITTLAMEAAVTRTPQGIRKASEYVKTSYPSQTAGGTSVTLRDFFRQPVEAQISAREHDRIKDMITILNHTESSFTTGNTFIGNEEIIVCEGTQQYLLEKEVTEEEPDTSSKDPALKWRKLKPMEMLHCLIFLRREYLKAGVSLSPPQWNAFF